MSVICTICGLPQDLCSCNEYKPRDFMKKQNVKNKTPGVEINYSFIKHKLDEIAKLEKDIAAKRKLIDDAAKQIPDNFEQIVSVFNKHDTLQVLGVDNLKYLTNKSAFKVDQCGVICKIKRFPFSVGYFYNEDLNKIGYVMESFEMESKDKIHFWIKPMPVKEEDDDE